MQPTLFLISIFFGFLFGASIGSFADAAASRTVADQKWWGFERSRCPSCRCELTAAELIPLLSYLFLRGRCRHCVAPIPRRHFMTELLAGLLGMLFVRRFGLTPALFFAFAALLFLLFHTLTDLLSGYIYDSWVWAMAACAVVLRLLFAGMDALIDGVLGAALGFAAIYLIVLLSRGGMGTGDAMLMLGTGALLGWRMTSIALYLGFMSGGVVVLPLLLLKKVSRKDIIPLGPFLATGAGFSLFLAGPLLHFVGLSISWPWNL